MSVLSSVSGERGGATASPRRSQRWTRFAGQARAEWRLQLRRPFVWFALLGYFLLAVGDTVQAGWSASGGAWINGADTLATRSIVYSLLSVLVAAGVVGEPMARDRASGAAGVTLTTGAGRWTLALGRFVVAVAIVLAAGLLFLPGVWLGTFAPGIAPEYIGPNVWSNYVTAAAVFVVPNFLLVSALCFAVSARFQSQAAAYAAAVGFVALWVTSRMLLGQDVLRHDLFARFALLDPFGSIASAEFTMGRTVAENNTLFPPLAGLLLLNRVLWGGVTVGLVGLGVAWFPMRERRDGEAKSRQRRFGLHRLGVARIAALAMPGTVGRMVAWELMCVVRAPGVKLIVGFVALTLWWAAASAVTHSFSLPSTDLLVHNTGFYFDKVLVLAIVWVAGDMMWRERSHGVDPIVDALPTRDTHRYAAKLIALIAVVLAFWCLSILVNLTYQATHGYFNFELGLHLTDTFVFKAPYYVFLAVLALSAQAIVRQRYVAMGVVLAVYLAETLFDALGWYHPLFRYGATSFFWYSLMDGYGHFWEAHFWLLLYWSLGAAALGLWGWSAFTRGPEPGDRWSAMRRRLGGGRGGVILVALVVCFVAVGGFIGYESTVRATWPPVNADAVKAEIERTYGQQWRGVRQPRVVEITGQLDLVPEDRCFTFTGTLALHNPHDTPIEQIMVLADPRLELPELTIPGGTRTHTDPELNVHVFELTEPLPPDAETTLTFTTVSRPPAGFAVHAEHDGVPTISPVEVIGNGTSLLNLQIMPAVGYTDRVEHKPAWKRRKFGLPERWEAPQGPDSESQAHATYHLGWVRRVDMTITTAPDQTAYHPGTLVERGTTDDGRAKFRWVINRPSRGWATIVTGRTVETRYQRDGLPDVILAHDPDHTHTLDAFAEALHDAIAHFTQAYGPPPFDDFYMVEQSLHFDGMGTRSGMGFASEVLGWKTDLAASGGEDLHAMAAHMMGMIWWGDQIIPANVAGAKVVHAGLPFWTAQLYLHQRRDPATDRALRKQNLLEAFRSRSALIDEEVPFAEEFKDSTMLRAKGAGQMLYLADLLGGPAQLEAVLANFLDRWRYRPAPFPTANDFVDHLAAALPAEHHPVLDAMFRRVTTWDLSVADARVEPDGDRWRLTARITARQLETVGWGETKECRSPFRLNWSSWIATTWIKRTPFSGSDGFRPRPSSASTALLTANRRSLQSTPI
ncbi:MAG: hypothetical protein AAF328_09790 [Planctomycetota bacterium]